MPNFEKAPCTITHGFFLKLASKSPQIFITSSNAYTCTYVLYIVSVDSNQTDSDQNLIFNEFSKLLQ